MKKTASLFISALFSLSLSAQTEYAPGGCDVDWTFLGFGTSNGAQDISSADLDGDGELEFIVSTREGFWYVLEYLPQFDRYWPRFTSRLYPYGYISKIKAFDVNGAGNWQILVSNAKEGLEVFDGKSLEKTKVIQIPQDTTYAIDEILLADPDNDGTSEFVIGISQGIYFFNQNLDSIENYFPYASDEYNRMMDIANVDDDPENELILSSGRVLQFSPGYNFIEKWDFSEEDGYSPYVKAADVDGDGRAEIVYSFLHNTTVYDVDTKSVKFTITMANQNTRSHLLYDVNGDGRAEILREYNPVFGGPGKLGCFDGATGDTLWTIPSYQRGIASIQISPPDSDGNKKILWWAGIEFAQNGNVHVADLATRQVEFISPALIFPEIFDVGDVDGDLEPEIVLLPYQGFNPMFANIFHYSILYIIDAKTHELEWSSDMDFNSGLPAFEFGAQDLIIADLDKDGDDDILIAYDGLEGGYISWMDPTNGYSAIKKFAIEPGMAVSDMAVEDVDGDGVNELVTAGDYESSASSGKYLTIYDINTWVKKWQAPGMGFMVFDCETLRIGNVDQDTALEVVFTKDSLIIFDLASHEKRYIPATIPYRGLDLYDFDGDGIMEIVAGRQARVHIIDGETLQDISVIQLAGEQFNREVNVVKVKDLNMDGSPEIVFSDDNRLFFYDLKGLTIRGVYLGEPVGRHNGLRIKDLDGDGKFEFLVSDGAGLAEIGPECAECLWFEVQLTGTDPTCLPLSGSIQTSVSGAHEPVGFLWNTGDTLAEISSLTAGFYQLGALDRIGCRAGDAVSLIQPKLITELETADSKCDPPQSGEAAVVIAEGLAPFNFEWSTSGTGPNRSDLAPGMHSVTVTDANFCESVKEFQIGQDYLLGFTGFQAPDCNEASTGNAETVIIAGHQPFEYHWSNGDTLASLTNLPSGIYFVTATDASGCVYSDSVTVPGFELTANLLVMDISCFGSDDGSVALNVETGHSPYQISGNGMTSDQTIGQLAPGAYTFMVRDSVGCIIQLEAVIHQPDSIAVLIAGITADSASTQVGEGMLDFSLSGGTPPYEALILDDQGQSYSPGASLTGGDYQLVVTDSAGCTISVPFSVPVIVAVRDNLSEDDLRVYPNPSSGVFTVSAGVQGGMFSRVDLLDSSGRLVTGGLSFIHRDAQSMTFSPANLPAGVYWIRVKSDEGDRFRKLVIIP